MSCKGMEERLNDYVGGYLSGAERREVEEHLLACPECRREAEALRDLLREVGELPKEIPPPPDLWREMVATIEEQRAEGIRFFRRPGALHAWWSSPNLAAAAAVLVIVACGVVALTMVGSSPGGSGGRVPGSPVAAGAVAPAAIGLMPDILAAETEFNRAADELLAALESRRADLPPETLRVIEENLLIINGAIADVRVALESDPSNARLGTMVTAMYLRKLNLLRNAAGLPAPG